MSSFIISEECMDHCVKAVEYEGAFKGLTRTDIGRKLFSMNGAAFSQRYRGEAMCEEASTYTYTHRREDRFAQLKGLRCLLYQSSEGDVPGTDLFKLVEEIANDLAMCIAQGLPEYEKAKWG